MSRGTKTSSVILGAAKIDGFYKCGQHINTLTMAANSSTGPSGALLCKRNAIKFLVEPFRVLYLLSIEHGILFEYTISTSRLDINIGIKFGGGMSMFVTIFDDDNNIASSKDIKITSWGDLKTWLVKLLEINDAAYLNYFAFQCSTTGHYVTVCNSRQYEMYSQKFASFDHMERCAFNAFHNLARFLN